MATIKHDEARGTTWVKWRAGGRSGVDCSATFDTKGGGKGPHGWAAFAAQLAAEGHPAQPSGWTKQGRRWIRTELTKSTTELLGSYGLRYIDERLAGSAGHRLEAREGFLRHVVPVLGKVWLDELSAADIDRWQNGLDGKLAPSSIRNLRGVLRKIVRHAVLEKYADIDVVSAVAAPKGGREYESAAIEFDELAIYLAAARKVDELELTLEAQPGIDRQPFLGDLVELMLLTSLRIGELSALGVTAFRPATATRPARLVIASSLKGAVVDGKRAGKTVGKPKSKAGERTIVLDDRAAAILRVRTAAAKLAGHAHLFVAPRGGPLAYTTVKDRWARMLVVAAELGAEVPPSRITPAGYVRLGITPHGLRATHISYRLSLGHAIADVQHDAGHAQASTTLNTYTRRVSTGEQRTAQMTQLGAIVGKAANR